MAGDTDMAGDMDTGGRAAAGGAKVAVAGRQYLSADEATLITAGAALMLIQYVASRELGSTLFASELVVLGATLVTLLGPSLGYALSGRLRSAGLLRGWGVVALLLQLALPVGARALVGVLCRSSESSLPAALLLAGGVLLVCAFYAMLLPLRAARVGLPRLYACELAGALLALLLIGFCPAWRLLIWAYCGLVVGAAQLVLGRTALTLPIAALAVAVASFYPRLDAQAASLYYAYCRGHEAPVLVATAYSPYQRVDVIQDPPQVAGAPALRTLYLDGVPHFRSGDLALFPQLLAALPGSLMPKRGPALVIGSGSFSAAGHLHRLGYEVTVVELDEAVARLGFRTFADAHQLQPGQVRLVLDDARRFLSQSHDRYQLIALDVPAPYHLQTALLHTPAFYRLVAAHLAPGGVAALSLCDELVGPVGSSIAASAASAFDELLVLQADSLGLAVLYASASGPLPFSIAAAATALGTQDRRGGRLYGDAVTRQLVRSVEPLSEAHLIGVLTLSAYTLPSLRIGVE